LDSTVASAAEARDRHCGNEALEIPCENEESDHEFERSSIGMPYEFPTHASSVV